MQTMTEQCQAGEMGTFVGELLAHPEAGALIRGFAASYEAQGAPYGATDAGLGFWMADAGRALREAEAAGATEAELGRLFMELTGTTPAAA